MTASLSQQLEDLPADTRNVLKEHHFDKSRLLNLAQRLTGEAEHSNHVSGTVAAPAPSDVGELPQQNSSEARELEELGMNALRNGECAMVVLAGGMATRMGGVVKSLVEALPGKRFLDLRLAELATLEQRSGRRVPLWLMTSQATDATITQALGANADVDYLATFTQFLSARLTKGGDIFLTKAGEPSLHSPGHGDLPDALRKSGLLSRFVERGGKYLTIANIDNLGASLDPTIIGYHIKHGKPATCEVVDKLGTDKGGIPARHNDRPVVLEEFRIPPGFDPATVRVFSTNTFHVSAEALVNASIDWSYFTVEKKVEGEVAIQFERLLGELTSYLDTQFLRLPREGAASRFLPVKDYEELEARQNEITLVARDRGMIE